MQKTTWYLVVALMLVAFLFQPASAQQQLKIGTDIPLQYGLAYQYSPEYGIGGGLKLGILTEPHNSIILEIMEALGTRKFIVDIIRDGFKMGFVMDGSASWHWDKNYVGANLVFMNLSAGEAPLDVIDNNYDFNLQSLWPPFIDQTSTQINLNSNLMQMGVHYGRRIPLKDKFELQLEFGLTKNIGSTNIFTSDFLYPEIVYKTMDEDLRDAYKKYAIIPTLGIYLVYNIGNI